MKIIVVGSGIVGSSTAYHLARKGIEVIVVDQAIKVKQLQQVPVLFAHGSPVSKMRIGIRLHDEGHCIIHN